MDRPTDGIANNAAQLGSALEAKGVRVRHEQVRWAEDGWAPALRKVKAEIPTWGDPWVVVAYTPLMWSPRGLPFGILRTMRVLRRAGLRVALHLHDVLPAEGPTVAHRARARLQSWAMAHLGRQADARLVSIDPARIPWFGRSRWPDTHLIVSGSAVPEGSGGDRSHRPGALRLVVFGLTDRFESAEARELASVLSRTAASGVALSVDLVGRGSDTGGATVATLLADTGVDVTVHGLVSLEAVAEVLDRGEAMVFLRNGASSRRSSLAAGLAQGLPVVAYSGPETAPPVTDAGVVLVPLGDTERMSEELVGLSRDGNRLVELSRRSEAVYQSWFAWPAIATRLLDALGA